MRHNEAKMIDTIVNDILGKLNLTPSKDIEDFVGMEDHIAKMSVLMNLESEKVRMVGIWGSSGIGKTTIARALYSRLHHRFQSSVYIDRAFISKSKDIYNSANPDDYNMKLHLQKLFLSEILDKQDLKIDRLGAVEERLKHHRVLIFIDDLDDQMVLNTLVGQTQWFGCGSRIIVITKDKHFLRAHGIDHVYEVCLPSSKLALEIFSRSAFQRNSPPYCLMKLAYEVVLCAGNLPLGLNVLGSYLRGREKEEWMEMLPSLRNRLNGKIERTLRVSYDGLNNKKDEAIFRHISCLFNGEKVNDIKLLLADSDLDVNTGFKNLVDKSLVQIRDDTVEMHCLIQEMGKEIVRQQSTEPGEHEFLMDPKDICNILENNTGTKKVLGISLDIDEIDEVCIHQNAFKEMTNILFLNIYTKEWEWEHKKEVRWHLRKPLEYFPHKLRLLRLDRYPMRYMPSNFRPENLVKLQMPGSKLERLWEGVHSLRGLKTIDLKRSIHLKEIPDLSMATNLETLGLCDCSSLVELPSSIQYLNKLEQLVMSRCINLETLPTGINLQSLDRLDLQGCSKLKIFPEISTNMSNLNLCKTGIEDIPSNLCLKNLLFIRIREMVREKLWERVQPLASLMTMVSPTLKLLYLSDIPSLVELPASIQNFSKLERLEITNCRNLETLATGINIKSLIFLDLSRCSRLRTFPDISTNIKYLYLRQTGTEEVPWWIENFTKLESLYMSGCNKLHCVSSHISKLKNLHMVDFLYCRALTEASWNDSSSAVAVTRDNNHSSFPDNFINCFNLYLEPLLQQELIYSKYMKFSGEEVLPYFTHRTNGTSLTNIPFRHTSPSQKLYKFKACVVVDSKSSHRGDFEFRIKVSCRFKGRLGNYFDSSHRPFLFWKVDKCIYLTIFECCFPLNEDDASEAELNYEHVDIQFHMSNSGRDPTFKLKGCGILPLEDCS